MKRGELVFVRLRAEVIYLMIFRRWRRDGSLRVRLTFARRSIDIPLRIVECLTPTGVMASPRVLDPVGHWLGAYE